MDYKLQPITIQQTNWPAYIELYTELFGSSPTRCLDEAAIPLDKPIAFVKSLDDCIGGDSLRQVSFGFMGSANSDMLIALLSTDLNIATKEATEERGVFIFMANGSIRNWMDAIILLTGYKNKHIATLGEQCRTFLRMAGYKI